MTQPIWVLSLVDSLMFAVAVLDLEQFKRTVDEKKDYFEEQRKDWEKAFEQARKEEQDRIDNGPGTTTNGIPWHPASSRQNVGARFDFVRELGKGQFGHVCLVQEQQTGELFAQKFISAPLATTESGQRKMFKDMVVNEVKIMNKLQHHHIAAVSLYLEADDGFSLIMPTVGDCNLHYFLQQRCINAKFPRKEVKLLDQWFGCLVFALAFAHTNFVKHEDLKLSNILIKGDRVYLADFGCATDFGHASSSASGDENKVGTIAYWPPEQRKERGRSADIFSLGCVFSEMLTVRQGRTLDAYLVHRKVEDHESPYRFSRNLPAVQDWLKSLPGIEDDVPQFFLEIILVMILWDKDQRKNARQLKKLFRGESEGLFCESCS
jgi:serine/threonine protein kinase